MKCSEALPEKTASFRFGFAYNLKCEVNELCPTDCLESLTGEALNKFGIKLNWSVKDLDVGKNGR